MEVVPSKRFVCELCCYDTDKSSSYEKHLYTWKHIRNREAHKVQLKAMLVCDRCQRRFKKGTWYSRHVAVCDGTTRPVCKPVSRARKAVSVDLDEPTDANEPGDICIDEQEENTRARVVTHSQGMSNEMLMTMMEYVRESERKHGEHMEMMQKQLDEERNQCKMLMNTVQDMIPKIGNFNNNKISINIFLQEHCKDALNLKDFVDSLRIELSDVSKFQDRSTIDAVGNVFVNGLRQLDLYKRPIHCMDLSRETLYIKDNGAWENDTTDNGKLSDAITAVAAKQSKVLQEWERIHPDWCKSDELTAEYLRLVRATTCPIEKGSSGENKIRHNIAKEVVVDLRKVQPV